jgi:signal peptidase I
MSLKWVAAVVVVIALLAGAVALHPLFKRYRVPSESMTPTLALGDKVNLNGGAAPTVGDVVIFRPPAGAADGRCGSARREDQPCAQPTSARADVLFVKRIVAGPGDRVAFRDGRTIRNGRPAPEPYVDGCTGPSCDLPREAAVPAGMYFLVGDKRDASDDSRFWGPVPRDWILGRAERCQALYFACSPVR